MSKRPAKLALLVRRFPKLSETFILSEILGLERAGFDVTVFSMHRPSDAIAQPAVCEVRAPVVYLDCKPHGALADLECALKLAVHLRTHEISHLHAHFIDRPAGIAAVAARLADVTFSLSAHAKDIYLADAAVLARRLRQATFVTTCTEYNREALLRIAPNACVHRVYHGIDTHQFDGHGCGGRRKGHILAVGRLRAKKGFATLVEACASLHAQGLQQFRCDIVGYGEQQQALQRQIEARGLADRVQLRGKMTHAALIELYRHSEVFAAPCEIADDGDRDGIPNVLLEAMAMELPVVSTSVSGIGELVRDGVNGILVEPADAAALAAALAALLRSQELRTRLGTEARCTVMERFAVQNNLPHLIELLTPYVERARGRQRPMQATGASRRAIGYAHT